MEHEKGVMERFKGMDLVLFIIALGVGLVIYGRVFRR